MPAFAKNFVHFETTMMIKIHVMSKELELVIKNILSISLLVASYLEYSFLADV